MFSITCLENFENKWRYSHFQLTFPGFRRLCPVDIDDSADVAVDNDGNFSFAGPGESSSYSSPLSESDEA